MQHEDEVSLDDGVAPKGRDVTPKHDAILESQRNERKAQAFTALQNMFVEGASVDVENERIVCTNPHFAIQVYQMLLRDGFYTKLGISALELKEKSISIYA